MRFSERIGKAAPRVAIQTDGMDGPLRNCIWNVFSSHIYTGVTGGCKTHRSGGRESHTLRSEGRGHGVG